MTDSHHSKPTTLRANIITLLLLFMSSYLLAINNASAQSSEAQQESLRESLAQHVIDRFGNPPAIPSGSLPLETKQALDFVFIDGLQGSTWGIDQIEGLKTIVESNDPRLAWLITDLMRVVGPSSFMTTLTDATDELLSFSLDRNNPWGDAVNHLIAWDIPAPPNCLDYKRNIYTLLVPEWEKLFTQGDIDWRHVSWGGVRIDDRAFDTTDEPCNCIPAADNPKVSSAEEADWLADDDIVFGIEVNGEYRAYPRRIMEVREMVNDTLGGRHLGIPYCTLCGSAQAYFTDDVPEGVERPILRTSGLLIRSNKVMYDLNTYSVFDTFRGNAVNGPLAEKNVALLQAGVVTTEWGEWKAAHPDTTVLEESLALGRDFDFRNNRDANGPIFPIGDVDPRLPVQEDIVGLITDQGEAIAFTIKEALQSLKTGKKVSYANIELILDGGGIKAVDKDGKDLGGHQAFWFAWSQFHPGTKLWPM